MADKIMSDREENKKILEMEQSEQSDENSSRILEHQEINNAELDVMKGDSVGETLYSAKWILNTLISLSKIYEEGWNESVEHDLCMLWDMTAEKDVVKFLLDNDFFKMAEFTLKTSEEPRLTEIIVGIIGNMCCETESLETLVKSEELVSLILSLTSSDDKETLIQVLRILQAALWDIQKNHKSLWLEKIKTILGESITFILKSSTSDELLVPTIDFIYTMSDVELPNDNLMESVFDIDQLIFALCEAMTELISQKENPHSETELKNIDNWFGVLFNVIKMNLLKFSDSEDDENFKRINTVLLKVLQPYEELSNLMPSDEKSLSCIYQCLKLVNSFQTNEMSPDAALIESINKVAVNLKTASSEKESGDSDNLTSLHLYASRCIEEGNIEKNE